MRAAAGPHPFCREPSALHLSIDVLIWQSDNWPDQSIRLCQLLKEMSCDTMIINCLQGTHNWFLDWALWYPSCNHWLKRRKPIYPNRYETDKLVFCPRAKFGPQCNHIWPARPNTKWLLELSRWYYTAHVSLILQIPECSAGVLACQSGQDP